MAWLGVIPTINDDHQMNCSSLYNRLSQQNKSLMIARPSQNHLVLKFCIYHGFGGGYSYSNMTNYFKMNIYCKFYGKTVIVTTAHNER